ncbi:MAG TPA: lipoyl(octanoyl) transferase LipB [Micropepsaceae bacterium]|jgi:lipoyl(octanoyl) transferase|nr:lipoyl(octanoyl) transferase LipB [Micropepsaceae bacterium]
MPATSAATEWTVSQDQVSYPEAVRRMEQRVDAIHRGEAPEGIWLLEHPPLYTAGSSAKDGDLLSPRFPVFKTGRGGQYTYHGPGQRVAYVMLDLKRRNNDVRRFVRDLEEWVIRALAEFGIRGERRAGRVGIWIDRRDGSEDKIGAIGVRVRHWVTFHGISLNVDPELEHFAGIVPCGVRDERFGVTSLAALGIPASMQDVDAALKRSFQQVFGA